MRVQSVGGASRAGAPWLTALALLGCGGGPEGAGEPRAADDPVTAEDDEVPADDGDLAVVAAAPPDAPLPAPLGVSFGRDGSERIFGVHIHDRPHRDPRVVYSVRLRDLRRGEELRLRGEVTLSRCNPKDVAGLSGDAKDTPCDSAAMQRDPYAYTPNFSAAFVLAGAATDAGGVRVSDWQERACSAAQHHCALALDEVAVRELPDAAERFLNLVVTADANGRNARAQDVMEVEQAHGALDVTRIGGGAAPPAMSERSAELLETGGMGVDQTEDEGDPSQVRRLLYRVRLDGLRAGDVISAGVRMRALLGAYGCDPLITGQVIVTEERDAKEPRRAGDERLTAKNGHNCSDHGGDGCKYEKSGAARLGKDAPSTMFVSYVATAVRSCAAPDGGDRWRVDPRDGFLAVSVRR